MKSKLFTYPPKLLDDDVVAAAVAELPRFGRVRYFVRTDSTNARALAALTELDGDGISFVTETQDAGRGRAGRIWASPPGAGLLCSTILPTVIPNICLPAVGYWGALAAAAAVVQTCGVELEFKWPNDLLFTDKKCGGVLCEGRALGSASRVVLGLGLNVNRPEVVPDEIAGPAAWLSDVLGGPVDRTALAIALLRAYEQSYDGLLANPVAVFRRWERRATFLGKHVIVKNLDGSALRAGIARGIADDGALLLEEHDQTHRVMLGDVQA